MAIASVNKSQKEEELSGIEARAGNVSSTRELTELPLPEIEELQFRNKNIPIQFGVIPFLG